MILLHFSWEWQQRAYLRCWPLSGLIDWATRAAGDLNGNFLDKLCLAFQVEVNEAPLATASTLARAPIRDTSNPSAPYQAVGTILLLSHFQQLSPFYVPLTFFFFFLLLPLLLLGTPFFLPKDPQFPPFCDPVLNGASHPNWFPRCVIVCAHSARAQRRLDRFYRSHRPGTADGSAEIWLLVWPLYCSGHSTSLTSPLPFPKIKWDSENQCNPTSCPQGIGNSPGGDNWLQQQVARPSWIVGGHW